MSDNMLKAEYMYLKR